VRSQASRHLMVGRVVRRNLRPPSMPLPARNTPRPRQKKWNETHQCRFDQMPKWGLDILKTLVAAAQTSGECGLERARFISVLFEWGKTAFPDQIKVRMYFDQYFLRASLGLTFSQFLTWDATHFARPSKKGKLSSERFCLLTAALQVRF